MHQFIGELITSGNTSKDQPDVLNAAWGVSGAAAASLGFKAASLEPLQPPPPALDKTEAEAGRHTQPRATQRKGEARDRREGQRSYNGLFRVFSVKGYCH